jgi:hypothetical protein
MTRAELEQLQELLRKLLDDPVALRQVSNPDAAAIGRAHGVVTRLLTRGAGAR